jgi:ATP-dependent protease ClpP protease subunit
MKDSRLVLLAGSFTTKSAAPAIERILSLSETDNTPITLALYSDGGDMSAAIALYDVIMTCGVPVIGVAYAQCYSSAVLVLQACTLRIITPSSTIMLHEGSLDGIEAPTLTEAAAEINALKYDENIYWDAVSKRSGLSVAAIQAYEREVTYFTPERALREHLVDGILTGNIWQLHKQLKKVNRHN